MNAKLMVLEPYVHEIHSLSKGLGMVGKSLKNIGALSLKPVLKVLGILLSPPKLYVHKAPGNKVEVVDVYEIEYRRNVHPPPNGIY